MNRLQFLTGLLILVAIWAAALAVIASLINQDWYVIPAAIALASFGLAVLLGLTSVALGVIQDSMW